ncbi:hypothetical protein [Microbulbifer rhizosphaerae]|uniref:Transcriptional regulatory protein RtcR n=1 Tax=Microbulbifer rhizosphaerae TaxID=1562603 RepID=A0A7W4Z907_9GAMM|nr:hypothetical protein [Microbulbifer rhizosphaerae]MBB3061091.1 transcriptional regulatory protein RtcR [Microbulbifer rhizosphaerae]
MHTQITSAVNEEISRLKRKWQTDTDIEYSPKPEIERVLGAGSGEEMDYYDQLKLAALIEICKNSNSMAEAGRRLFNVSRKAKKSNNDSHRVKQLLGKYGIKFEDLTA